MKYGEIDYEGLFRDIENVHLWGWKMEGVISQGLCKKEGRWKVCYELVKGSGFRFSVYGVGDYPEEALYDAMRQIKQTYADKRRSPIR